VAVYLTEARASVYCCKNTLDDCDVAHAEELARFLQRAAQEKPSIQSFGRSYMNVLMKHGGDYIRESLHGIRRAFAGEEGDDKYTQMLESLKYKAPPDPCKRSNVDVAIEKYLKATERDQSNVYLNVCALLEDIKVIIWTELRKSTSFRPSPSTFLAPQPPHG
jgi:hypothetical protein